MEGQLLFMDPQCICWKIVQELIYKWPDAEILTLRKLN